MHNIRFGGYFAIEYVLKYFFMNSKAADIALREEDEVDA